MMDAQETALSYDNARLREELAYARADIAMLRETAKRMRDLISTATSYPETMTAVHEMADDVLAAPNPGKALLAERDDLRNHFDAAVHRGDQFLAELEQAQADYAMLRAVARRCFAEDTNDQDMLNLWNLAAAVEHPGEPLIVRYNKAMGELEQWRADKERMLAVDATRIPMDLLRTELRGFLGDAWLKIWLNEYPHVITLLRDIAVVVGVFEKVGSE